MKSPQGSAEKIALGRSLGYSDLHMGNYEASLGSRAAPQDFPRVSPSGNPLEQPCQTENQNTKNLDGVGLVDNRPFADSTLCPKKNKERRKKLHITHDIKPLYQARESSLVPLCLRTAHFLQKT